MRCEIAKRLNSLNTAFYAQVVSSFSETRQAPWPGWRRCLSDVGACWDQRDQPDIAPCLRVLDVACGNLRFAGFLAGVMPGASIDYVGVDSSAELPACARDIQLASRKIEQRDIVGELLAGEPAGRCHDPFDLAVSFGFLHHVPTMVARQALMRVLVGSVRPGGVVCVSLWRFAANEKLEHKAAAATREACGALHLAAGDLDEGDYLLGWQNEPDAWRYCHSFSEDETSLLAATVAGKATLMDRFRSDGRTGDLNEYLVLRCT